jgi:hypothetical protein
MAEHNVVSGEARRAPMPHTGYGLVCLFSFLPRLAA